MFIEVIRFLNELDCPLSIMFIEVTRFFFEGEDDDHVPRTNFMKSLINGSS